MLFGKFVRLKRAQVGSAHGTDLGLYISKQLVESIGVPGEGSRFYFTLRPSSHVDTLEDVAVAPAPMNAPS